MRLTACRVSALLATLLLDVRGASPSDSLTGNVMTDMVIRYIAGCAGVTFAQDGCVVHELFRMMFPAMDRTMSPLQTNRRLFGKNMSNETNRGNYYGDYYDHDNYYNQSCGAPTAINEEIITSIASAAESQCVLEDQNVTDTEYNNAIDAFTTFFGAKECWETLCNPDTMMELMATYFDTCAGIKLPYPLPPMEEMMQQPEFYEPSVKLGCMLDFTMSSNASIFGLEEPLPGSVESCYPPGHNEMDSVCSTQIGPIALRGCASVTLMNIGDGLFGSYGYNENDEKDDLYINNLCDLLEQFSSDKAKQCLIPLCGLQGDEDGGSVPTQSPTSVSISKPPLEQQPSSRPSSTPSQDPSPMPSKSTIITPTKELPTDDNTDEDSKSVPTSSPSSVPSRHPSSAPTRKKDEDLQNVPTKAPTSVLSSPPPTPPSKATTQAPTREVVVDDEKDDHNKTVPTKAPTPVSLSPPPTPPSKATTRAPTREVPGDDQNGDGKNVPTKAPGDDQNGDGKNVPTKAPVDDQNGDGKNVPTKAPTSVSLSRPTSAPSQARAPTPTKSVTVPPTAEVTVNDDNTGDDNTDDAVPSAARRDITSGLPLATILSVYWLWTFCFE